MFAPSYCLFALPAIARDLQQDALLKLHMLGEGGPRANVITPSGASAMSIEDAEQQQQLAAAAATAQQLTARLRVQNELKEREIKIKQKEIAHLNLLKHVQVLMQSAVSSIWNKLTNVRQTVNSQAHRQMKAANKRSMKPPLLS